MVQLGQGLGLADESFGKGGRLADAGRQNFQRHDPVKVRLAHFIDGAHAAVTQ